MIINSYLFYHSHCIVQPDNVNFGKFQVSKYIIVMVFGDDIFGLCCNGTIDELVVIRVSNY